LNHVAEAEEVAGDGVRVGGGVLGEEPPGSKYGRAVGRRGAGVEGEAEQGAEVGERFGEPEAQQVAPQVADGRGGVRI
jgi:hypothetical protein